MLISFNRFFFLKIINKLWLGDPTLFSYLTSFRESECKFSILFLYWNYSLVYPVFSGVVQFLSIGFWLRLVWFTFHRGYFLFHSLDPVIQFKPYISWCLPCSWGLWDSLIWILLRRFLLIWHKQKSSFIYKDS